MSLSLHSPPLLTVPPTIPRSRIDEQSVSDCVTLRDKANCFLKWLYPFTPSFRVFLFLFFLTNLWCYMMPLFLSAYQMSDACNLILHFSLFTCHLSFYFREVLIHIDCSFYVGLAFFNLFMCDFFSEIYQSPCFLSRKAFPFLKSVIL